MSPKNTTLSSVSSSNNHAGDHSDLSKSFSVALTEASVSFNERLAIFNLLDQLNHLCRGVQRHRGFSMGLLGGNESFGSGFYHLQRQMARRIQLITAFGNQPPVLLGHADIERLHYAWNTIHDNWQDDSVLENFEFHCHFVDQLLLLMARLAERVSTPYAVYIHSLVTGDTHSSSSTQPTTYQHLLSFASQQLPRFVEMLGKIRALSIHVAATGCSDVSYDKKLLYLLQCVEQEKEAVFSMTNALQSRLVEPLPALLTIKTYEYKLDFLLEKIKNEIVGQAVISISEEDIFRLVTDIIDIYWRVADDSINLLSRWQKDDMEKWLQNG
ncbi:MAG: hypothetical protein ACRBCI_03205 [Cellvibrionaceae bacterium]